MPTEFDIIVHGATGFTGRLVAEHLQSRYGTTGAIKWAMSGRSQAKLAQVAAEIGTDAPLIVADAADPALLDAMVARTQCVITTVGPYQLYGEPLLAIIAADRQWNEAAARTTLLKMFEATGLDDPWSIRTRARLRSVLFS